jgi:hypothetical protein
VLDEMTMYERVDSSGSFINKHSYFGVGGPGGTGAHEARGDEGHKVPAIHVYELLRSDYFSLNSPGMGETFGQKKSAGRDNSLPARAPHQGFVD